MFSGCGASPSDNNPTARSSNQQPKENIQTTISNETEDSDNMDSNATAKKLVVYFSMPETTEPENMSREEELSTVVINGEVLGNTQYVAYIIAESTKADIFRIEPVTPYPLEHSELEDIAQKEQSENFRPEIAGTVDNIDQYDTIFFGFPNWYYDMPMIMYSFLDQYDLAGKTVVPFVTSGGSGFSDAIDTIKDMEPDADVITDGLSISRNVVQDSESDIIKWLTDKGFIQ
ncbi:MAG: flavodoxin [Lachnospiraceae bacterium]|nr:flavodoxin [Lachnospiraceae bacterium]